MMNCVFCAEANDPTYANSFLGADWPYKGRIVVETEGVFVVPGYGPQVYPYALIITRRHLTSLAQTAKSERREIVECLSLLRDRLRISEFFVFEHAGCRGLHSCVEHFHLHVVDAAYDATWALRDLDPQPIKISSTEGIEERGSYLLAARFGDENVLSGNIAYVQAKEDQFFRRAIAQMLGQRDWDWRLGMNKNLMLQLIEEAGAPNNSSDFRGIRSQPVDN